MRNPSKKIYYHFLSRIISGNRVQITIQSVVSMASRPPECPLTAPGLLANDQTVIRDKYLRIKTAKKFDTLQIFTVIPIDVASNGDCLWSALTEAGAGPVISRRRTAVTRKTFLYEVAQVMKKSANGSRLHDPV